MVAKVLITDAFSSIGAAIYTAFEVTNYKVLTPHRGDLSWSNKEAVARYLLDNQVSVVINTLGWADRMTLDQERAMLESIKGLVPACAEHKVVVIQLSSFRVFGGENKGAYAEDDEVSPVSALGRAFLRVEESLASQANHYLSLRVTQVLDVDSESYFTRLLEMLTQEGDNLPIASQRQVAPISVEYLCQTIIAIVHQVLCGAENWGVFHLAASDPSSYPEFVEAISDVLDQEGVLRRKIDLSTPETEETIVEPLSAVLSVRRILDGFGVQGRSWRSGLKTLIRTYLEQVQKS